MNAPLLDAQGRPYPAVSLDVDGTLYRPGARVYWRAMTTPGLLRSLRLLKRAREGLRDRAFSDGDALRVVLAQEVAKRGGMQQQEASALLTRMRDVHWRTLLDGAAPSSTHRALRAMKDAGIRLAAFSDHDTAPKLAALGLETMFDVVVSGEDEGAYKPLAPGFERVRALLGVPASQVLHVGDREDTDGKGALAAGMGAALVGERPTDAGIVALGGLAELAARLDATRR